MAIFALILILVLAFPIGFYGMAMYLEPTLPNVKELKTMQLQMPLQIYTADNKLIGQYGNKYSLPVAYEDLPEKLIGAFLSAEDSTFYEHTGISIKGLGRALTEVATDDDTQTGGSTITMQVAKNYFLSSERTIERKLTELFIARKIENELTKNEILTLYVNKIYLGEGAYGIRAAAKKYFSKSLENLTIAEMAMLAGLPKAPSAFNPVNNPTRALERRNWIIGRMLHEGYITQAEHDEAIQAPIGLHLYKEKLDLNMPYLAEMARSSLVEKYGNQVMDSGWRVSLTVNSKDQIQAETAVIAGLKGYDHGGYRGVEALSGDLKNFRPFDSMLPAKVTKVLGGSYEVELQSGEKIKVAGPGLPWATKHLGKNRVDGDPKDTPRSIQVGNIVRVINTGSYWKITQPTRVQGALVSINPQNGALIAMVGGFNFYHSKFNRATQGYRQPGSIIKPLVYAAALETKKYSPESVISNAPLRIGSWRPKNAGGRAGGAVSMRSALAYSLNLPSIRIMQGVGIERTHEMLDQFGLEKSRLPASYTLALGATDATPLQMATAYSTFVNGGHRIQPYFIERIYNFNSETIYQASPAQACAICFNKTLSETNAKLLDDFGKDPTQTETDDTEQSKDTKKSDKSSDKAKDTKQDDSTKTDTQANPSTDTPELDATSALDRLNPKQAVQYSVSEQAPRILSAKTAYQMASMLRSVVTGGTATKANFRPDIGGKTGTTNQAKDVWFAGVHPTNVAVVWMGYDDPASLGSRAYGGTLALPVWNRFMRAQLSGTPVQWVSETNIAKSEKATQKVINLTDANETQITQAIEQENKSPSPSTDTLTPIPVGTIIAEGDGEDVPNE
ncbi:MAG: transglycosylase domain-containing protein [Moraxella sp.]|nr:transglycosylase domain-containing protein [Moraxella sp.]